MVYLRELRYKDLSQSVIIIISLTQFDDIMNYIDWLNYKDLEYRQGILYFVNLNTLDIAEKYGTPIYVINEQMIRKRYKEVKEIT
ncbi:MAG: hypothetical protein E3J52_08535 [Promethearchaeota archaeon]|nr:MAG: hypothetical protein E3J52_08535 [Candidatus Lokiarchaeota archaeon]